MLVRGRASFSLDGISFSFKREKKLSKKAGYHYCYDKYAIIFIKRGRGVLSVEGVPRDFEDGTLAVVKPFKYLSIEVDADEVFEAYTVCFSRDILKRDVCLQLDILVGKDDEKSGAIIPRELLSRAHSAVFDRFEYSADLPDTEAVLYMEMLVSELIILLAAGENKKIESEDAQLSARVIKYINSFLFSDISLDFLAKRFFVSKYYLCRSFKKYCGTTPHAYIIHKRIAHAKQLIERGQTASQAGYSVGFGDYSAFYRAYVKIVGKPPSA